MEIVLGEPVSLVPDVLQEFANRLMGRQFQWFSAALQENLLLSLGNCGPTVIASFLRERLVDEVCVYIAPKILGAQGSVGINQPMAELAESFDLHYVDTKRFGDDIRLTGLSKKALDEISI